MLNLHNAAVSFSGTYLFQGVSYKLSPGDRVGLIGKNGAGKSTMLKVLSKELDLDEGTLACDRNITIGVLKQDIDFVQGRTVLEESYEAFSEIKSVEREMECVNHELATRTDYESEEYHDLMVAVSDLNSRYEILGGYNYQGETERVLQGLGFKRTDFDRLTDTFSGGWRMRIELAKLLLQRHDVLLLDEPTNHLDIESILWLETFLNSYPGAVVIVSHDRMFLDNVTNRTIEISLGRIYDYQKPYTQFLALREEIREQQMNALKNQEKQIQQTEKLIEKFRAKATKASMAQSLIKKLDKIDRIEVDGTDTAVMNVRFPVSKQPGKVILELDKVSKSYGESLVLNEVSFLLERGSRTAFVGQNGQGKSTLAKIIVGELAHQGQFKLGHNVEIGYFAQNQAEYLDGEKTLLDTMIDAANESNRAQVRDILGSFLFGGDDVDKQVKVLSGGERNRLALAKLLLQPFNVLVMDEPTNHLDIKSKEVLKRALMKYDGAMIVVSHDRDFLKGLTDKTVEFRAGQLHTYLGDVEFFLEKRALDNMRDVELNTENPEQSSISEPSLSAELEYEERKRLIRTISSAEKKIEKLEQEIAALNEKLFDPEIAMSSEAAVLGKDIKAKQQDIDQAMLEWEQAQEILDSHD